MASFVVLKIKIDAKDEEWIKAHPTAVNIDAKRNLTVGEIKLSKLIFKDAIDYSKVKIIRGGLLSIPTTSQNAMTPFGSIHLPNNEYDHILDFSASKTKFQDKIWFIHEMTHVWQYQLGLSTATRALEVAGHGGYSTGKGQTKPKAYLYDLYKQDKGKHFNQFNFEQQAEIVSHYYDAFFLPTNGHDLPILHNKNLSIKNELSKVLKDFIVNPNNKNLVSKIHAKSYYNPNWK